MICCAGYACADISCQQTTQRHQCFQSLTLFLNDLLLFSLIFIAGKNTIETVSRAEALQRTKNLIKEINDSMLENYHDCDDHCTQALEGESFPGMVISPDLGGSQLRRSVWKKSPVWQFCTTNLNVHVMSWRKFSDTDMKTHAHLDHTITPRGRTNTTSATALSTRLPEAKLSTAASITFGAPAAHAFGFNEGT